MTDRANVLLHADCRYRILISLCRIIVFLRWQARLTLCSKADMTSHDFRPPPETNLTGQIDHLIEINPDLHPNPRGPQTSIKINPQINVMHRSHKIDQSGHTQCQHHSSQFPSEAKHSNPSSEEHQPISASPPRTPVSAQHSRNFRGEP
jgi:hypothetical protein